MKSWNASIFVCVSVVLALMLLNSRTALSHPLDDDSSDVIDDKMSAYVDSLMDMMNYVKNSQNSASSVMEPMREVAKRDRRPYRRRSGGMSLCLWKVCPAAPWLVKRSN